MRNNYCKWSEQEDRCRSSAQNVYFEVSIIALVGLVEEDLLRWPIKPHEKAFKVLKRQQDTAAAENGGLGQ